MQLSLDEDNEKQYLMWENIFHAKLHLLKADTPMLYHLLTTAYECLKSIIYKWERNKIPPLRATERLIDWILSFVRIYKAGTTNPSESEEFSSYNVIILIFEMAKEVGYENEEARENLITSFNREITPVELIVHQYGIKKELMQNKR
jgi:hypothetical protein